MTKSAAPAIVLQDICLDFDGRKLFDHLDLTIAAGKCTCLLGPSGCGKSTLLRLISGNRAITYSGTLSFSSTNHDVCWMSQNDLLLPWMSLLDNVMLGARLRRRVNEQVREKAAELLRSAGLSLYKDALPATLSGGMRQRGALLRTLMEERDLVLMDEPFSSLDALTRLKLQDLAAEMTHGKTVLLVTHDPMEALRMAHEIVVFPAVSAQPQKFTGLPGDVPRRPGDPDIVPHYNDLLAQL
ncbi:MAG: ABC transporter ATP-binding protein, partial [Desulfopila sp.]|nr:ABC transporter ATP-binding protein [Desulfopila sp.]